MNVTDNVFSLARQRAKPRLKPQVAASLDEHQQARLLRAITEQTVEAMIERYRGYGVEP